MFAEPIEGTGLLSRSTCNRRSGAIDGSGAQ